MIKPVSNLFTFIRILMPSSPWVFNNSFLAGENCFIEYINKTEPERKRAIPKITKIIDIVIIESRDLYPNSHHSLNLKKSGIPVDCHSIISNECQAILPVFNEFSDIWITFPLGSRS